MKERKARMKKLKLIKIMTISILVYSALVLNPTAAKAEWKQDNTGWWYDKGNCWSVGWEYVDGEWYYFDNNGYMRTGWILDNGKWYYLYNNGIMAENTTINGYALDSSGAWIQTTQNSSINSEKWETIAKDYVKAKGYEIIDSKGENSRYTLEKNMFFGLANSTNYREIWGVQKVEPDKYFGKQIITYEFTVKNHPLENKFKVNTNVFIMISDGQVIGGFSFPDEDLDGAVYSLDGKTLVEVTGLNYPQWLDEWEKKYGNNNY